MVIKVVIKYCP